MEDDWLVVTPLVGFKVWWCGRTISSSKKPLVPVVLPSFVASCCSSSKEGISQSNCQTGQTGQPDCSVHAHKPVRPVAVPASVSDRMVSRIRQEVTSTLAVLEENPVEEEASKRQTWRLDAGVRLNCNILHLDELIVHFDRKESLSLPYESLIPSSPPPSPPKGL